MRPVVPLVMLALLASIVTGREHPVTSAPDLPTPQRNPQPAAAAQDLDLDKLIRQRQERRFTDLFAVRSLAPPPVKTLPPPSAPEALPVAAVAPPATPVAPPLPFAYLGRIIKGDRTLAYLLRGDEMHIAETGQMLGEDYRVEGITDSGVHFVYVPLGAKQVLGFPARE